MRALRRVVTLALGNVAIFAVLFVLLELGVRIARDGLRETASRVVHGEPAPYSAVGTGRWMIADPELGYRLNPAEDGVNALAMRGPEIATPKPPGRFRMVVLGDSIPFAKNVFGFVEDLGQRIGAGSEVVNAGVPGYTTFQELTFLERWVAEVEPDLVLWSYCLNDNHRFLHRFDEDARMLFTDEAARSLQIRTRWDWIVSRSYVLTAIRMSLLARRQAAVEAAFTFPWEARMDFNVAWKDHTWGVYESHLAAMVDLLERRGARLAIVVFPFEPQLLLRTMRDRRDEILAPQRHLERLCRKYAVPCLDLYPPFERAYDDGRTLYRDGIHPNQEGHALTTELVLEFLTRERLLPVPERHGVGS